MNTRKQVFVMVILLMIGIMGIAAYSAWDPDRNVEAGEHFNEKVAERGSILFARNCRLCHGDVGEGGALGGRLTAAPSLNRPALQGFIDSTATVRADVEEKAATVEASDGAKFKAGATISIDEERMRVTKVSGGTLTVMRATDRTEAAPHSSGAAILILDAAVLQDQVKMITNTLTCGRVGTAMPIWAQSQGGPLSDEQLRQLTVLITENWWELVAHEVDIEDATKSHLQRDVDEKTISLPVTDISFFTAKEALRIGDERIIIEAVPKLDSKDKDKSGVIQVTRGVLGSIPAAHTVDEEIFKFPLVAEPALLQSSCGQTARPAGPTLPPGEKACAEPCQTVDITAVGVQFNTKELRVSTGGNVRIHFTNNDQGVQHNVAVYQSSSNLTAVASGSVGTIFEGVAVDDIVFAKPATGSYFFRCDVHPTTMTGTFVVQ